MSKDAREPRLSQMGTHWSVVQEAHSGATEAATDARHALLEQYSRPIRRYLLGALRNPDAADEVFQEFSLRLLRGDLQRAHPERGRFRDLVKTALFHLTVDYQRQERRRHRPLPVEDARLAETAPPLADVDREFQDSWRECLLERTWEALQHVEATTGQPCHTVLRLRIDHPGLSSAELAEEVGRRLNKQFTVPAIRQALYRAREKFADLFLEEVASSLRDPSSEDLVEELSDLGLLSLCWAALQRRGAAGPRS